MYHLSTHTPPLHTPGHTAIGVICDGLTIFEKTAGKPKKLNTLRKLPADLLNSMDAVSTFLNILMVIDEIVVVVLRFTVY